MSLNDAPTILAFGELLWDIIDGHPYLGGAPFNLAAHAAQLGINAYLISRVGDDELGRIALEEALRLGVNMSGVMLDTEHGTGTVDVRLREGQPSYIIHCPVAWDYIEMPSEWLRLTALETIDAVCFGTLAQRSHVSQSSLRDLLNAVPNTPAFYDVNLRQEFYTKDILEWGLRHSKIVKMNEPEARLLSLMLFEQEMTDQSFANVLQAEYELDVVLITMGANGCRVLAGKDNVCIPGRDVRVQDAVGAGDAFSAAFLSVWLRSGSAVRAATFANMLGAYVATQKGAVPECSGWVREQINDFLEDRN